MTEPTDAELDELRQANSGRLNFVTFSEFRTIARAVLAKWGTTKKEPQVGCEGSVLEDAAQVEIDLFNDLNRIYGNTLTAYAKEMCRLGYRKTNAARKQGETNEH